MAVVLTTQPCIMGRWRYSFAARQRISDIVIQDSPETKLKLKNVSPTYAAEKSARKRRGR